MLAGHHIDRHHLRDTLAGLVVAGGSGMQTAAFSLGKGTVDETSPAFASIYTAALSGESTRRAVENADCLILAGAELTDIDTGGFSHRFDPGRTIALHPGHAQAGHTRYDGLPLEQTLDGLTQLLREHPAPGPAPSATAAAGAGLTQAALWERLSAELEPGDILIADIGTASFGAQELRLPAGARFICQSLWYSIGYALGAQLTAQAIGTAARHGAAPIVIVLNNDGYTVERAIHGPEAAYNDVAAWNYTALPAAFGAGDRAVTARVTTAEELNGALTRATAAHREGRLSLVEAVLDRQPPPAPHHAVRAPRLPERLLNPGPPRVERRNHHEDRTLHRRNHQLLGHGPPRGRHLPPPRGHVRRLCPRSGRRPHRHPALGRSPAPPAPSAAPRPDRARCEDRLCRRHLRRPSGTARPEGPGRADRGELLTYANARTGLHSGDIFYTGTPPASATKPAPTSSPARPSPSPSNTSAPSPTPSAPAPQPRERRRVHHLPHHLPARVPLTEGRYAFHAAMTGRTSSHAFIRHITRARLTPAHTHQGAAHPADRETPEPDNPPVTPRAPGRDILQASSPPELARRGVQEGAVESGLLPHPPPGAPAPRSSHGPSSSSRPRSGSSRLRGPGGRGTLRGAGPQPGPLPGNGSGQCRAGCAVSQNSALTTSSRSASPQSPLALNTAVWRPSGEEAATEREPLMLPPCSQMYPPHGRVVR